MAVDETNTRAILTNRTNVDSDGDELMGTSGPSSNDRKRPIDDLSHVPKKRPRQQKPIHGDALSFEESSDEEEIIRTRECSRVSGRRDLYGLRLRSMASAVGCSTRPEYPTRSLLQSFVSSDKADVFKCHSECVDSFVALPYACSYSHDAKRGNTPLLAVATEQGTVHILNTTRRKQWDVEPQQTTFQPYPNGIFDVQWSHDDTLIATASGGQRAQVSQIEPTGVRAIHQLLGHSGTVKCISWDPTRAGSVLSTGGRDGSICVWDLRVGEGSKDGALAPVIKINGAHDEGGKLKPRARKGKLTPAAPLRSVTSLFYSEDAPNKLVSSGSVDGIVRQWDLLMPDMIKRSGARKPNPKGIPIHQSSIDPTTYQGTRRARGISSLSVGSGPSAGFLFALGNDSLVHTYDVSSLEPLSGRTTDSDTDPWSYGYQSMRTSSFNVRAALSPCGRWLASGGVGNGSVYLFDVAGGTPTRWSARQSDVSRRRGVQLCGQTGEVGVVDWADGMLASCADDGTVRIWRPDIERYRECQADPTEMRWNWKWATDDEL